MGKTTYQIADKTDSRQLTEFLCQDGQFLLPMVELITGAEMAGLGGSALKLRFR